MIFQHHVDGCTISAKQQKNLEERFTKLQRFSKLLTDPSSKIHTKIVRGLRHQKPNYGLRVQITIPNHLSMWVKCSGPTLRNAIDAAEEKLAQKLRKVETPNEKRKNKAKKAHLTKA